MGARQTSLESFLPLLRSHILSFLPGALRVFAYRVWRQGLRKTFNTYMLAGACYLVYLLKRIWIREYIIVHPQPLGFTYLTWKLARLSGYKIVRQSKITNIRRRRPAIAHLYHQDSDHQDFDSAAINGRCIDITKTRVNDVFHSVFGYSLMIDPTLHVGQAVRKSDANARHDGCIVECPIGKNEIEESFTYQRLVDNTFRNELVREFRVCVIGDKICEVEDKYRDQNLRFKMRNSAYLRYIPVDEAFDDGEQLKIIQFCKRFGLDVGELDILRDNTDGRLYIVDANKTATTFGTRRPWLRFQSWYRRARVFRRFVEVWPRSTACGGNGAGPAMVYPPRTKPGHLLSSGGVSQGEGEHRRGAGFCP